MLSEFSCLWSNFKMDIIHSHSSLLNQFSSIKFLQQIIVYIKQHIWILHSFACRSCHNTSDTLQHHHKYAILIPCNNTWHLNKVISFSLIYLSSSASRTVFCCKIKNKLLEFFGVSDHSINQFKSSSLYKPFAISNIFIWPVWIVKNAVAEIIYPFS